MQLSYRSRLILGICLLVLFSGAAATWLAHRSARSSTSLAAFRGGIRSNDDVTFVIVKYLPANGELS